MKYFFNFDTRYLIEKDYIVIRKGLWNTIDGRIPISEIDDFNQFKHILDCLSSNEGFDELQLKKAFSDKDKKFFENLIEEKFVRSDVFDENESLKILSGYGFAALKDTVDFSLITDSALLKNECNLFAKKYGFNFTEPDEDLILKLDDINYFDRVNALEYEKRKNEAMLHLGQKPILVIQSFPNIALLRNLNKIASKNAPLFIGMIDGPYLIFLSVIPFQTACFECFETRMLSSLHDHVLYNKFLSASYVSNSENDYNFHLMHLLHMGLQEVCSYCKIKMSKFAGRSLFIYLPTFELHFHDILRVSSCSVCGALGKRRNRSGNENLNNIIKSFRNNLGDK